MVLIPSHCLITKEDPLLISWNCLPESSRRWTPGNIYKALCQHRKIMPIKYSEKQNRKNRTLNQFCWIQITFADERNHLFSPKILQASFLMKCSLCHWYNAKNKKILSLELTKEKLDPSHLLSWTLLHQKLLSLNKFFIDISKYLKETNKTSPPTQSSSLLPSDSDPLTSDFSSTGFFFSDML